jgi:CDP-paratose 2-epimerase
MQKKILITGGAGFVGSNLALNFKRQFPETKVVALDNLKRRGSELNLSRLRSAGVAFVHGDIRNKEDLAQVGTAGLIIECSAEPSVSAGYGESPAYLLNTNLLGTINCLELAREQCSDFIFISTSRIYPIKAICSIPLIEKKTRFEPESVESIPGFSSKGISEEFTLEGARSLYGATKLASELLVTEYQAMYGLRTIINRCGVLTGPWQMGKVDQGFVVLWVARHVFGGELSYFGYGGKGKQVRDILHIEDLFDLLVIQLQDLDRYNGQTYNVGGGNGISVSLQELTQLCHEITQSKIKTHAVQDERDGDIPYYVTDSSKVISATGWRPKRKVKQIIDEITHWITQNKAELHPILR